MARCVIVGAAEISRYDRIRKALRQDDFFLFCDGGLDHKEALGVNPDLVVGDFDSHPKPENSHWEIIVLPREKDDTDTAFAVKEALRRGFDEFLFVGVLGGRMDHSMGNLSLLMMLDSMEKRSEILDDFSVISVVSKNTAKIPDAFSYFSLLCLDGPAHGITVENAKYPLSDATITPEYSYGISNEVLPGKVATVRVKEGRLLLIQVW